MGMNKKEMKHILEKKKKRFVLHTYIHRRVRFGHGNGEEKGNEEGCFEREVKLGQGFVIIVKKKIWNIPNTCR